MRFLAAMGIVIYHYGGEAPVPLDQVSPLFLRGYLATDFFLILSGFIMTRVYSVKLLSGAITPFEFLLRRIARVWPGHLVVLAALIALVLLASVAHINLGHPEHFLWSDLPAQIFLIQSWGSYGGGGWNLPSWSLSALIGCYALTPLALRAARQIGPPQLVLALAVAILLMTDGICRQVLHRPVYDLPFGLGVVRAMPLFLLGMATAQYSVRAPVSSGVAQALLIGAVAGFLLLLGIGRFDFLSMIAMAVILFSAGSNPVRRPSWLWQSAAQLSFAVFITHVLTATVYFGVLHKVEQHYPIPLAAQWAIWAFSLPLALIVALAFDRFIERPLHQWFKLKSRIASLAAAPGLARS